MQYSVISYIHPPKPVLQCMYSIISWSFFILYSMYCTPSFFFKFFILPELYTCFFCFSLQCLSTQYSYFCFNILSVLYSVGTPVFSVLLYYCTVLYVLYTAYSYFCFNTLFVHVLGYPEAYPLLFCSSCIVDAYWVIHECFRPHSLTRWSANMLKIQNVSHIWTIVFLPQWRLSV